MDDVVIPTSDPVKTKVAQTEKPVAPKEPPGTVKNFFLVMPLALVLLLQAFYFGKLIGSYTTFPLLTVHSYVLLAGLGILLLTIHLCLRSIIYGTIFGLLIVTGIFTVWFGDFWSPLQANFHEAVGILRTSLSQKDMPYPIFISLMMSLVLAGMACGGFFLSLFTKYFFEVVFGRDWSDGRYYGFGGAVLIMLGVHLGFSFNVLHSSSSVRIQWNQPSIYSPLEEYLTRIHSATQYSPKHVWAYEPDKIGGLSIEENKWSTPISAAAAVLAPAWMPVSTPFVAQRDFVTGYDNSVWKEIWRVSYPDVLPGIDLEHEETKKGPDPRLPILVRAGATPDSALFMFDYGVWGSLSLTEGKWEWIQPIDARARANRVMLEALFDPGYIQPVDDLLVFSCHNAKIVAVNAKTGEKVWEYNDKEPKYSGRSQRAFLSVFQKKLLAAFPAGALVAFDGTTGQVIHDQRSSEWHPVQQAHWVGDNVRLFSENGWFYEIVLDGGRVVRKQALTEKPLPLVPLTFNLAAGFGAYRDTLFNLDSDSKLLSAVFRFPRRILATNIVQDDSFIYFGTQDGWVICLHAESFHEKWRVHVRGELGNESLIAHPTGLFVRTCSGSLISLAKGI